MEELDDEWIKFINGETPSNIEPKELTQRPTPEFNELYISTKTKLLYLNQSDIDVSILFWNIPVVEYWKPLEGVTKNK